MNESWLIYGICSHNGSCVDGAVNHDFSDIRDCPVRPDIDCNGCPLRGLYL